MKGFVRRDFCRKYRWKSMPTQFMMLHNNMNFNNMNWVPPTKQLI